MKSFDVAVSELLVREDTDTALYSNVCECCVGAIGK